MNDSEEHLAAWREAQADIVAGRYQSGSVREHMEQVAGQKQVDVSATGVSCVEPTAPDSSAIVFE